MSLKSSILYTVGIALKKARHRMGFTQEEYAKKVGLHRSYLGAIERGERNISLLKAFKLCQKLQIKIGEIFIKLPIFL